MLELACYRDEERMSDRPLKREHSSAESGQLKLKKPHQKLVRLLFSGYRFIPNRDTVLNTASSVKA